MAKQWKGWKDEEGGLHNTERQALAADAEIWKKRARKLGWRAQDQNKPDTPGDAGGSQHPERGQP